MTDHHHTTLPPLSEGHERDTTPTTSTTAHEDNHFSLNSDTPQITTNAKNSSNGGEEGLGSGGTGQRSSSTDHDTLTTANADGTTTKKRKKKGWKGWALVLEDEAGNVIEVRDRGESPPPGGIPTAPPLEKATMESREGSANVDGSSGSRKAKSASPFVGTRHLPNTAPAANSPLVNNTKALALEKSRSNDSRVNTGEPSKKRPKLSPKKSKTQLPTLGHPSTPTTALQQRDTHPSEPQASSSSTPLQPSVRAPANGHPTDRHGSGTRTGTPNTSTATASASTADKLQSDLLPRATSSHHKAKGRHTSPTRTGTAQLREDARLAREARSRVTTPNPATVNAVVVDDTPLPKVPRVGMGELYPPPPESDVRTEGLWLIEAAKRRREEDERSGQRRGTEYDGSQGMNGLNRDSSPMEIDGSQPRPDLDLNEKSDLPRYEQQSTSGFSHPGLPFTSNGLNYSLQHPNAVAGPSNTNGHRGSIDSSIAEEPMSFEAQFANIQASYASRAKDTSRRDSDLEKLGKTLGGPAMQEQALGRSSDDFKPPRFHPGQRPTVVLAPANGKKQRDRGEREYQEGYDGLTKEVENDCDGFVNNVRDNLRNIITYFFPQHTPRRDAFLEKIGRGLIDLGWQLTDNGDAALE